MNLYARLKDCDNEKRKIIEATLLEQGQEYGLYPVTTAQYGIWCAHASDLKSEKSYDNMCCKLHCKGKEKEWILEQLETLSREHTAIRYRFIELKGQLFQYVDEDAELPIDTEVSEENNAKDRILAIERKLRLESIDLRKELPVRFHILEYDKHTFTIFVCMHHIICDGVSLGIFAKAFYEKLKGNTYPANSFAKYIIKQGSKEKEKDWDFWKDTLKNNNCFLELSEQRNEKGSASYYSKLSKYDVDRLQIFIQEKRMNMQALMMAVYSYVLGIYADVNVINIGTTVARRNLPETWNILGDFATTLPVFINVNEAEKISDYVEDCQKALFDVLSHDSVGIVDIMKKYGGNKGKNTSLQPFYQVVFALHNQKMYGDFLPGKEYETGDCSFIFEEFHNENTEEFPLYLCTFAELTEEGMQINTEYAKRFFYDEQVKNIVETFVFLIRQIPDKWDENIKNVLFIDEAETDDEVIMDKAGRILPDGFCGQIMKKSENGWIGTKEWGTKLDSQIKKDPFKSRKIFIDNREIDLDSAEDILKQKYSVQYVKWLYIDEERFAAFYSKFGDVISPEQWIESCGKIPLAIRISEAVSEDKANIAVNLIINKNISGSIWQTDEDPDSIYIVLDDEVRQEEETLSRILRNQRTGVKYALKKKEKNVEHLSDLEVFSEVILSDTEQKLVEIWEEILGHNDFSIEDKFYEVGGTSLSILLLAEKIRESMNYEIQIMQLFEFSTVAEIARLIERNTNTTNIKKNTNMQALKF